MSSGRRTCSLASLACCEIDRCRSPRETALRERLGGAWPPVPDEPAQGRCHRGMTTFSATEGAICRIRTAIRASRAGVPVVCQSKQRGSTDFIHQGHVSCVNGKLQPGKQILRTIMLIDLSHRACPVNCYQRQCVSRRATQRFHAGISEIITHAATQWRIRQLDRSPGPAWLLYH